MATLVTGLVRVSLLRLATRNMVKAMRNLALSLLSPLKIGGGLSRLTTLWRAVGNDEGLDVEVIDVEQEVGEGKAKDAEGK